jgi:hypothetical protein
MPLPSSGVFYFIFKMYGGYIESNFVLQNSRWWQDICSFQYYATIENK